MLVGSAMNVRVVTIRPEDTVQIAIARMMEEGIGSVVVCDGPRLAGIFTERDALQKVVDRPDAWKAPIDTVMTRVAAAPAPCRKRSRSMAPNEGTTTMPIAQMT